MSKRIHIFIGVLKPYKQSNKRYRTKSKVNLNTGQFSNLTVS